MRYLILSPFSCYLRSTILLLVLFLSRLFPLVLSDLVLSPTSSCRSVRCLSLPGRCRRELGAAVGLLTDTVEMHGGDILKFAGDAIIVCWSPTRELGMEVRRVMLMRRFSRPSRCRDERAMSLFPLPLSQMLVYSWRPFRVLGQRAERERKVEREQIR